jgi:hypothetical protein
MSSAAKAVGGALADRPTDAVPAETLSDTPLPPAPKQQQWPLLGRLFGT